MKQYGDTVLDFLALAKAVKIKAAPDGHGHNREGWTHFCCPWCRDKNYHLGYNHQLGFFRCLKCGRHPMRLTAVRLLRVPEDAANDIMAPYWVPASARRMSAGRRTQRPESLHPDGYVPPLPYGCGPMLNMHWDYLIKRGYDPELLEEVWGLLGTGHLSDKGWALRIIIPVTLDKRLVSYQGRDITDKAERRYNSCTDALSAVPLKSTLYGFDQATGESVLVVEGPTSVWSVGPGAVCTWGTSYTQEQLRLLRTYRRRFICFDNDGPDKTPGGPGGIASAKLAADLDLFGGETYIVTAPDGLQNPSEMASGDINELRRSCGIG